MHYFKTYLSLACIFILIRTPVTLLGTFQWTWLLPPYPLLLHHYPTSTIALLLQLGDSGRRLLFFFWRLLMWVFHGVAKSQTWLSDFTFTFHFYALEKEMATHSSVLAWRIPGMGSHRVGHDWSDLAVAMWVFCPMYFTNSPSRGAWWAQLWPGWLRCPCLELPLEGEAGLCHGSALALRQAELRGDCRLGLSIYSWGLSN